ncbi:MAG: tetratricopeptide repeat protein, partial [Hespellia sp.]|nr:tetratricopeptide repeat protein [Hespellia sp.]
MVEYSDQIAAKDAQINAQKTALDEYRSTNDESEAAVQTAASTSDSYENLMTVSEQNDSKEYTNASMAETLKNVKREALGTQGQTRYDELVQAIYVPLCDDLYSTAVAQIQVANYSGAIDSLSQVVEMMENYNDGKALLNLGVAYAKSGDTENANTRFNQVVESFPDTDVATEAKTALGGDTNVGAAAQ